MCWVDRPNGSYALIIGRVLLGCGVDQQSSIGSLYININKIPPVLQSDSWQSDSSSRGCKNKRKSAPAAPQAVDTT